MSESESYSPQLRTALVLTGTGTAGAYHAGVLRALHEAGVKLDVVAGRGVGVIGALFAAVDGAQRLWDEKGFWRAAVVRSLYGWHALPRLIFGALAASVAIVALPLFAMALGLIVFPIDFVMKMVGAGGASGLVGTYLSTAQSVFAPDGLPTWLPRIVVLVLGAAGAAAALSGWASGPQIARGPFWWRVARPPLSSESIVDHCWRVMWDLVRGAAALRQPTPGELGRRYVEMLADNLGQPGFRELLICVHDVDAHRDLVFALVVDSRRRDLVRRPTSDAAESRRAEVFDLAGVARDYLPDAVAAALSVPLATDWRSVTFAPDAYWRGETHRLCDRPGSLIRVVDELIDLGVEQVVLVSAAPETPGPHALAAPRLDGRGRLGELVQSFDAAIVRDATTTTGGVRIFTIRPAHNPVGPFDFSGGFDDRSHRRQGLGELMNRGYEDAYHQFIEPVVGASGERVGHVRM
ncbi:MAG TPA: patatin-like phospholipase family protein [Vicinamibacterales bacterium]|nr:patatin-like phospholipase family protein [Vicinamibacterales bacterium]